MYKSIFLDYFKQISNAISWYILIQLLFSVTLWFVLYQIPKYKLFMLTSLTLSIIQIGLSTGYLLHHEKTKHSLIDKTEFGEEWRAHEKPRIEKLILGYRRTISIWLTLIGTLCLTALSLDIVRLRHIAIAFIIQLGFTLIMDIYGRVKTEYYYQIMK